MSSNPIKVVLINVSINSFPYLKLQIEFIFPVFLKKTWLLQNVTQREDKEGEGNKLSKGTVQMQHLHFPKG